MAIDSSRGKPMRSVDTIAELGGAFSRNPKLLLALRNLTDAERFPSALLTSRAVLGASSRPPGLPDLQPPPGPTRVPTAHPPRQPGPVPSAPSGNPFDDLPFPSPGDRIKADHFKALSQSLRLLAEAQQVSSALFGQPFGTARTVLESQGYSIQDVMSVHGHELTGDDNSLDERKVLIVRPVRLGESGVAVVVSEVSDVRRTMPNLTGMTYGDARDTMRNTLGNLAAGPAMSTPNLVGQSLAQARL